MSRRGSIQVITDYLALMEKEAKDSRDAITLSVQYLLVRDGIALAELADEIGVTRDHIPNKIRDGRWKFEDLDVMGDLFDIEPSDLLRSPKAIQGLTVSRSIRHLMDRDQVPLADISDEIGVTDEQLTWKITDGEWSTGEINTLATFFAVEASDISRGPNRITRDKGTEGDDTE